MYLYVDEVIAASEAMVVTSDILESASGLTDSSISGAEDRRIIEGKLPVVVLVAEAVVATVIASLEVKEVKSYLSAGFSSAALVADRERTRRLAAAASQAGQGKLALLKMEFVSELELLLSLQETVELPNLDLL